MLAIKLLCGTTRPFSGDDLHGMRNRRLRRRRVFLSTALFLLFLLLLLTRTALGNEDILRAADAGHPRALAALTHVAQSNDDPRPLFYCVRHGLSRATAALLDAAGSQIDPHGTVPGGSGSDDTTPLHVAAAFGQIGPAKELVRHGADVNRKMTVVITSHGGPQKLAVTPLYRACEAGQAAFATYLLTTTDGTTRATVSPAEIHVAITQGHADVVKVLLNHSAGTSAAVVSWLTSPSHVWGMNALHLASHLGHVEIVRHLVLTAQEHERDASTATASTRYVDLETPRPWRATALHLAATMRHVPTVRFLLETGGARVDNAPRPMLGVGDGSSVYTTLHQCVRGGAAADREQTTSLTEVVSMLVEHGHRQNVDVVNVRDMKKGTAPLTDAAEEGMTSVVRSLLRPMATDQRARALNWTNGAGDTALHVAVREGRRDVAALLLEMGGNVSVRDSAVGATPLHHAAHEGRAEMAEFLLSASSQANAANATTQPPTSLVVDAVTSAGRHTPLHAAAYAGHVEVAQVLLRFGANPWVRDEWSGHTPLSVAEAMIPTGAENEERDEKGEEDEELRRRLSMVTLLKESMQNYPQNQREKEEEGTRPNESCSAGTSDLFVNVSYKLQKNSPRKTPDGNGDDGNSVTERTHQVYPLPVFNTSTVDNNDSSQQQLPKLPPGVYAAGLRTSQLLRTPAVSLLWHVERLRRRLCAASGAGATRFWSEHFPLQTLAHRVRGKSAEDGEHGHRDLSQMSQTRREDLPLLAEMLTAFETFLERVKEAMLPALGCRSLKELHCPIMGAYQRIERDHYLGQVHREFPGKDDAAFFERHGVSRNTTWNVWVLLSERAWGNPLAVFDPAPLRRRLGPDWEKDYMLGWVDPPEEADSGGWRAYTYMGMEAGDIIAWRTTQVPHAGARRVPMEGLPSGDDASLATFQHRQSIDFRCQCIEGL